MMTSSFFLTSRPLKSLGGGCSSTPQKNGTRRVTCATRSQAMPRSLLKDGLASSSLPEPQCLLSATSGITSEPAVHTASSRSQGGASWCGSTTVSNGRFQRAWPAALGPLQKFEARESGHPASAEKCLCSIAQRCEVSNGGLGASLLLINPKTIKRFHQIFPVEGFGLASLSASESLTRTLVAYVAQGARIFLLCNAQRMYPGEVEPL